MKVLMLDVDGVLVNGRPSDGKHLFTDLERDLGVSRAQLAASFFDVYWEEIVVGRDALKPRLAAVLREIAPHLEAQRLIDYWFENDSRIDTELLATVDRLRTDGLKVMLATNQEHLRARFLMDTMGLGTHVDGIAYSAALGYRKPMPGFYAAAANLSGNPAAELVLVDDVLANVEAAKVAGWHGIHWTGDQRLEDALASIV